MPLLPIEESRIDPFLEELSVNFQMAERFSDSQRKVAWELIDRIRHGLKEPGQNLKPEERQGIAALILAAAKESAEIREDSMEGLYARFVGRIVPLIATLRTGIQKTLEVPSQDTVAALLALGVTASPPTVSPSHAAAAYRARAKEGDSGVTIPSMPAFKEGEPDLDRPLVVHHGGAFFGGNPVGEDATDPMIPMPAKVGQRAQPSAERTHLISVRSDGTREPEVISAEDPVVPREQGTLARLGGWLANAVQRRPAAQVEVAPPPSGYSAAEFGALLAIDSKITPDPVRFFATVAAIHHIQSQNNRIEYGALVRQMADQNPVAFLSASRDHHIAFKGVLGESVYLDVLKKQATSGIEAAGIIVNRKPDDFGITGPNYSYVYTEALPAYLGH